MNYLFVDFVDGIYGGVRSKLKLRCPIHGEWETTSYDRFLHGCGCPKCGHLNTGYKASQKNMLDSKLVKNNIDKYIELNNLPYSFIGFCGGEYHGVKKTNLILKCKVHGIWETSKYKEFINGRGGCPKCKAYKNGERLRKPENEIINNINTIIKDSNLNYVFHGFCDDCYKNGKTKLVLECPIHGIWKTTTYDNFVKGTKCPNCRTSKGEDMISSILNDFHVEYIREKRFSDCIDKSSLPFDFYLPDYNILIEYDGEQHFIEKECFGGKDGFEKTKFHDEIKNKWATKNGFILIRFSYKEQEIEIRNKLYELLVVKTEKIS